MVPPPQVPYAPPYAHSQYHAQRPIFAPSATESFLPDLAKRTIVGYELLANQLKYEPPCADLEKSENILTPSYRKFEALNHRVLLHLQDEISVLENDLRDLDECIAQLPQQHEGASPLPASRRNEAHYGTELHHRRVSLLGNIFKKLEQYSKPIYVHLIRLAHDVQIKPSPLTAAP